MGLHYLVFRDVARSKSMFFMEMINLGFTIAAIMGLRYAP